MPLIPEPTLFGAPPPDASQVQTFAYYAHFPAFLIAAFASVLAFARAPKKGVVSHLILGAGLALAAGAAFAAKCLYANFIYGESTRAAGETALFLMAGAALLVTVGVGLVPGFEHRRGAWLRGVIPLLATAGFAVAGAGRLPVAASAGVIPGIFGGVLLVLAGGLFLFDKTGSGDNAQEKPGASLGFAFVAAGLLVLTGAALSRGEAGEDKAALMAASAETVFAIFALFGVLTVAGRTSDFVKKKKVVVPAAHRPVMEPAVPPPGYVPPPPGGVAPPPPPGGLRPPPGPTGAPPPPGH